MAAVQLCWGLAYEAPPGVAHWLPFSLLADRENPNANPAKASSQQDTPTKALSLGQSATFKREARPTRHNLPGLSPRPGVRTGYMHSHAHTYMLPHMYTHAPTHVHKHVHTGTHTAKHTCAHIPACMQTHTPTYAHSHLHTHHHALMCVNTAIHTCAHTHAHMCIHLHPHVHTAMCTGRNDPGCFLRHHCSHIPL